MISRFEELLKQLANLLNTPLHVDTKGCCAILVDERLKVQLELDKSQEKVILSGYITSIIPGRFRENVLIEALKENDQNFQTGILGYSSYNDMLALFLVLSLHLLNGEILADQLASFIAKAMEWQNAIRAGYPAPISTDASDKPLYKK